MRVPAPPLLIISDRRQAQHPLEELAQAAFTGGCRWFSLREKDLPEAERAAMLRALVALGRRWGATVTVHGNRNRDPKRFEMKCTRVTWNGKTYDVYPGRS